MNEWVSISGQALLPLALRQEAEDAIKALYTQFMQGKPKPIKEDFKTFDVDWRIYPEGVVVCLKASGIVTPGEAQATLCRLNDPKTLGQFRIVTANGKPDFLFLGPEPRIPIWEQLVYKLDAVIDKVPDLNPRQQERLLSVVDELLSNSAVQTIGTARR
jgi:hypothetical protein